MATTNDLAMPGAGKASLTDRESELKPSLDGERTPWDKVRELAVYQLNQMISLEPKVLRGNKPRAIHDFRVASRRFERALDILIPSPRAPEVRRVRRRTRRCRRACSEVRNCDVMILRSEKVLAVKPSPRREAWQAILDRLHERRKEAHAKALRKLTKLNLARIYVHLRELLRPDAAAPWNAHPFGHRLNPELERAWQRFETATVRLHESSQPEVVHAARIAAKKFRYLVEILDATGLAGSGEVVTWLRKLQRFLGDWHDLDVERQMIAEMFADPQFLRDEPDLSIRILRIIIRNRKRRERFEAARTKWTLDSAGGEALKSWVQSVIGKVEN